MVCFPASEPAVTALTPAWIQAAAAIIALGVTFWLARLTASYVRLTGKLVEEQRLARESTARTADVRVSIRAFAARKALADWIVRSQRAGWADMPMSQAQDAVEFSRGILESLEHGLVDAAVASPDAAARLRTAYAHCQRAVMQFESYLGTWLRLGGAVSPADSARLTDGRESLRGCYLELEHVVEPALLAEARRLNALPATQG